MNQPAIQLRPLAESDAGFILKLVNTPGWLRFIGDRNVHSDNDALQYIQKIMSNPTFGYQVISDQKDGTPMGVITLLQRENLPHPDLGFALLPEFAGKDIAFQASKLVLNQVLETADFDFLMAITLEENIRSISLLKRLGFRLEGPKQRDDELVQVYVLELNPIRNQT
jgi:ribosomal-protein-alanine N-acetyltransferase